MIFINVNPMELLKQGNFLEIPKPLLRDDQWYYKLRGVKYVHGILKFPKEFCRPFGNRIIYQRNCDLLTEDLKCAGHPDKKPKICQELSEKTPYIANSKIEVTANCLFKYKAMEVQPDVTTTKSP